MTEEEKHADLEALERNGEIFESSQKEQSICHAEFHTNQATIRAPLPRIEGLRAALKNVCEPQKDVSFQCPECQKDIETHNGEWFLWCGDKAHAEALIKAARAYLKASEVKHLDDINVADMEGSK